MPRVRRLACLLLALLPILPGCTKGPAWGSENAVIAVVDPALRDELESVIRAAFEREVFTTRPEAVFEVTFVSTESLGDFRRWRRIVVFQPAAEPGLAAELLGGDEMEAARAGGAVAEVRDEWALDQSIWVVAAPTAGATVELARATIDSLFQVLYDRYVVSEVEQMWVSGADSTLAEELFEEHGFAIVLPKVYRPVAGSQAPATRTWYNEEPRRIVSLHWTDRPAALTPDTLLAIRRAWGATMFAGDTIPASITTGTAVDTTGAEMPPEPLFAGRTLLAGRPAVRLQGVWHNPQDHTSGVFVTYGVACGERLVLLDGNLFAPERTKIPYIVQLDRIFATFRCAAPA
jgi:hypothetical protein